MICLTTATTEHFVPGTLVMIGTFLEHHPGFKGDIVVFHDALPGGCRDALSAAFEGVRFEAVSTELAERLAVLRAARPDMAPRLARLYSLEAFRLHGYRKVLYCDSDLLFRASVAELFASDRMLLCCHDGFGMRGVYRDAATFLPTASAGAGVLDNTFNTGFLLIDQRLTDGSCHAALTAMVSPATWRRVATKHMDQFVLNHYFAGRQTSIGKTYNYSLSGAAAIRAWTGLDAEDAKVWHFTGDVKPWMPGAMLRWTRDRPKYALRYHGLWHDSYLNCLAGAHLRSAAPHLRSTALRPCPTPCGSRASGPYSGEGIDLEGGGR